MAKNYSYPRVTMSTVAKKHSNRRVSVPDTTILFAPLWTEKGPDDRVVKVHSINEFIDVFGSFNEDFYNYNGQQALNVYNWLNNGGTLLVKRLIIAGDTVATYKIEDYSISKNQAILYTKSDGADDLDGATLYKYAADKIKKLNSITINETDNTYNGAYTLNGKKYSREDKDNNSVVTLPYTELLKYAKANNKSITGEAIILEDSTGLTKEEDLPYGSLIHAKYRGKYYGNLKVTLKYRNSTHFDIIISQVMDSMTVNLEKHVDRTLNNYLTALSNSEYLALDCNCDDAHEEALDLSPFVKLLTAENNTQEFQLVYAPEKDSNEEDFSYSYTKTCDAIEEFFTNSKYVEADEEEDTDESGINNYGLLLNHLETPIDLILDAGYPVAIKNAIGAFVRNNNVDTAIRPDIVAILDDYVLGGKLVKPVHTGNNTEGDGDTKLDFKPHGDSVVQANNIALYKQYFTVNDAVFTQQNIYVTPTYFLASLIPYNDRVYGIQYPTAGLTRGLLVDALSVNENPDPDTKEAWFQARTNYAERTSKETAFMTQRTNDGSNDYEYTALSFLNNVRVLERMKKDLESIGRSYLHEFNDATTLANMSSALNKYVSTWIANRTLSLGGVEVAQNEISENALDINLTIRFTNTIEVINVSIVIE